MFTNVIYKTLACGKCGAAEVIEKTLAVECSKCGWLGTSEEAQRAGKARAKQERDAIEKEDVAKVPRFIAFWGRALYAIGLAGMVVGFVSGALQVPDQFAKVGLGAVLIPVAGMIPGLFLAFVGKALSLGSRGAIFVLTLIVLFGVAVGAFVFATEGKAKGALVIALTVLFYGPPVVVGYANWKKLE